MKEKLAALAHKQWSGWMKYLFRFGTENPDGTFTMDADKVARWRRQMSTDYIDLSESEKESDRTEARKTLEILQSDDVELANLGVERWESMLDADPLTNEIDTDSKDAILARAKAETINPHAYRGG